MKITPHRNIILFYFLTMMNNSWFLMGNWLFFWLMFMTYGQLGWIDASCFAFGMFMEVPTGAISDLIGKKKTLSVGMLLATVGFVVMSFATHRYHLLVGFLITQAGWAFYSGASEALAYDTLKQKNEENFFDKVISTSSFLSIVTTVFCALIGIKLFEISPRLPHIAMIFTYGSALIATFFLIEPRIDTEKFSFSDYFSQLKQGFFELTKPSLIKFVPLMMVMLGVYYMFSFGFIKPAISEHFHFYAREQGFIFAGLSILSAVLVKAIPWMRKKFSDDQGLIILTSLLGVGFLLVGALQGWGGLLVLTLIVTAGSLSQPWVSVVINREIESKYRATTLSTVSMITKIPYILVAVLAGQMIENGLLVKFCIATGLITLLPIALNILFSGQLTQRLRFTK
jgi:MFS family permease